MDFAYCTDCKEMSYAVTDSNGVFDRNKAASNHWSHRNIIFTRPPIEYISPVCTILVKLGAQLPISNIEMQFFKLALDLAEDEDINVWHANLLQKNQQSARQNQKK